MFFSDDLLLSFENYFTLQNVADDIVLVPDSKQAKIEKILVFGK
jgi:hypothetical protein